MVEREVGSNLQKYLSSPAGHSVCFIKVLVFLCFDQTRYVREKKIVMTIAPTIVIASAATSLPYLLPLAQPLRYRYSSARVPVTEGVIDGIVVLMSAR